MTQPEKRDYTQLVAGAFGESTSGERFTRKSAAHDVVVGSYPLADIAIDEFAETQSILLHQGPRRLWVPESKAVERQ
jgi:hypothetical protein